MKKEIIVIVVIICCLLLFSYPCAKIFVRVEPKIHDRISKTYVDYTRFRQRRSMHKPKVDIASLPALKDEEDAWYTKYHVIAHSGGGIEGRTYTDSVESWEYSYSRGTRVFDADCTFTTDDVLVLKHGWTDNLEQTELPIKDSVFRGQLNYGMPKENKMDYKTFMQTPIFRRYTPQDLSDMIRFMQSHPDIYVATDMKENEIQKGYSYIVNLAKEMNAEDVLGRIIVSVYNYKVHDTALAIYPFKNFALRVYGPNNNYYELAEFCLKNKIHVVNVWTTYMEDEGVKLLTDKGIHIITAVVDYISDMQEYRKLGSSGCVSNFLYEDIYNLTEP